MENSTFYGMQASVGTHEATKATVIYKKIKKKILRERRNICGGRYVYVGKTTRGVGD